MKEIEKTMVNLEVESKAHGTLKIFALQSGVRKLRDFLAQVLVEASENPQLLEKAVKNLKNKQCQD
jgi:hypothetical protein